MTPCPRCRKQAARKGQFCPRCGLRLHAGRGSIVPAVAAAAIAIAVAVHLSVLQYDGSTNLPAAVTPVLQPVDAEPRAVANVPAAPDWSSDPSGIFQSLR